MCAPPFAAGPPPPWPGDACTPADAEQTRVAFRKCPGLRYSLHSCGSVLGAPELFGLSFLGSGRVLILLKRGQKSLGGQAQRPMYDEGECQQIMNTRVVRCLLLAERLSGKSQQRFVVSYPGCSLLKNSELTCNDMLYSRSLQHSSSVRMLG